jgi:two-component system sensor histidine kinase FlrB
MEVFSLQKLLARVVENMHDMTENNNIKFDISNNVQVDEMLGNEDALLGAIMNLLNNAVEAQQDKALVTMVLNQIDQTSLQIQIQDNGPGIDSITRQRLFEPFYTTKVRGTGLGLAVVDSVVRAHSGSIQCESTKDTGTLFSLLLPCVNQYTASLSDIGCHNMENIYETV